MASSPSPTVHTGTPCKKQSMPSKLPRLFHGLSCEQRRQLAAQMLEEGHTGSDLERAIRFAVAGGQQRKRCALVRCVVWPWRAFLQCTAHSEGRHSSRKTLMCWAVVLHDPREALHRHRAITSSEDHPLRAIWYTLLSKGLSWLHGKSESPP